MELNDSIYVRTHLEAEASADSPPCGLVWRVWEGLAGLELSDSIYVRTHIEARGIGGLSPLWACLEGLGGFGGSGA